MNTGHFSQTVVVFFGMTASGKSYLSAAWAKRRQCIRFNTDVVRKESIARMAGLQRSGQGINQGIYTPELTRRTYDRLLDLAETSLAARSRDCVVLDGSYQLALERKRVMGRLGNRARVYFVYCHCSEAVTRKRLAGRLADQAAVSDGNIDVYLYQCRKFEKPTEIGPGQLLELDTDAPVGYLIDRLEQFLSSSCAGNTRQ